MEVFVVSNNFFPYLLPQLKWKVKQSGLFGYLWKRIIYSTVLVQMQ